jgi:hypothetical protein
MMNRSALGWAGLAVAAATAAAVTLGTGQATATSARTLVLTSRATTSTLFIPCHTCVLNSVPPGAHIGGVEIDAGRLLDRGGHQVGHFALESTGMTPFTAQAPGELMLIATLVINGSQLTAQSLEEPPNDHGTAVITGGTGAFLDARGTVQYTDNPDGSTKLRINVTS